MIKSYSNISMITIALLDLVWSYNLCVRSNGDAITAYCIGISILHNYLHWKRKTSCLQKQQVKCHETACSSNIWWHSFPYSTCLPTNTLQTTMLVFAPVWRYGVEYRWPKHTTMSSQTYKQKNDHNQGWKIKQCTLYIFVYKSIYLFVCCLWLFWRCGCVDVLI